MMKKLSIVVLSCLISMFSIAQNEEDALRYSSLDFGGTARYNSLAGAFGALGADPSVLNVNPAGMARYKNSEFTFTPQVFGQKTNTTFMGTKGFNSKEKLTLGNIAIVGVSKAEENSPYLWKSVQFGFAYNKLADFSERYTVNGTTNTSLSYVFAANATDAGVDPGNLYDAAPFGAGLAYEAYLIDPSDSIGTFYTTQMYNGDIQTTHTTVHNGSIGETALSVSGNYNNKIYLGATIGFPKIRFDREKTHTEIALDDSLAIDSFTYSEFLSTRGNGYNLKVGAIFLPVPWLRIGAAVHTPTAYRYMKDYWSSSISTNFNDGDSYSISSPDGSYLYRLKTPGRFIGSAAVIIRKKGLISIDYEYVDYTDNSLSTHKFSDDNYSFKNENSSIRSAFRGGHNIRAGAEYKLQGPFMIRTGFAYYSNPYKPEYTDKNGGKITYAGGFGYRSKEFFIDLGYTLTKSTKDYYMYSPVLVENTPLNKSVTSVTTTIGFKF